VSQNAAVRRAEEEEEVEIDLLILAVPELEASCSAKSLEVQSIRPVIVGVEARTVILVSFGSLSLSQTR